MELKSLVENQTKKKIKVLTTGNGGEFCGKEFEKLFKQWSITRKNITPYTT